MRQTRCAAVTVTSSLASVCVSRSLMARVEAVTDPEAVVVVVVLVPWAPTPLAPADALTTA
jgi:hypothetical protein